MSNYKPGQLVAAPTIGNAQAQSEYAALVQALSDQQRAESQQGMAGSLMTPEYVPNSGPHDVDSLCLMTINAGVPIQPDDLIAGEVELADALVEQAHAAEVEARMHQATPPTDTAH